MITFGAHSALMQLKVAANGAVPDSMLDMVVKASWPVQVVLLILALLSLVSWAIIFLKWSTFRRNERAGAEFVNDFIRADGLNEATIFAKRSKPNPFVAVYSRGVHFLDHTRPAISPTADRTGRLSASQVEALRLVLDAESGSEREKLGTFITWLATVGSVSPLIGLFGTVVGVISSFNGLASKGAGNLTAVAPGIAEALIATASALAVAIPAAFAYNLFASRLNRLDTKLEGFGSELIALLVREERI
jgi:biopolymer transport protein TolQ